MACSCWARFRGGAWGGRWAARGFTWQRATCPWNPHYARSGVLWFYCAIWVGFERSCIWRSNLCDPARRCCRGENEKRKTDAYKRSGTARAKDRGDHDRGDSLRRSAFASSNKPRTTSHTFRAPSPTSKVIITGDHDGGCPCMRGSHVASKGLNLARGLSCSSARPRELA